jgi:hypothetical protein
VSGGDPRDRPAGEA